MGLVGWWRIGRAFGPWIFFGDRFPGALPQAGMGRAFSPLRADMDCAFGAPQR